MKLVILFSFITVFIITTTTFAGNSYSDQYSGSYSAPLHWWDTDNDKEYAKQSDKRIPFPQCLLSGAKSSLYDSSLLRKLFDESYQKEEEGQKYERYENNKHRNYDKVDYDDQEYRKGPHESRTAARTSTNVAKDLLTTFLCDLKGTDSRNLNNMLNKFELPEEFCSYQKHIDCDKDEQYRTADGVCNNCKHPYYGASQTAFGRLLYADYDDYVSEPRRKSRAGGLLPSCRRISLELGTKPVFNRLVNNFFVIFGQFIAHDLALSTPVSDTYSTPISSCKCGSKYDWNKCNVIPVQPDDPYLGKQKCMAFPATAQAFQNQICSLGVKEQMNGNTHTLDLSVLYGSTKRTALALRGEHGTLKSTRPKWSKMEIPPGQREGKSCSDATDKQKCLTAGDSRIMENLLLTGIDTMFLRFHNQIAKELRKVCPKWDSDKIYEETRKVAIAGFQLVTYLEWLPTLVGENLFYTSLYECFAGYDERVPPVVFNEFATSAFRCHTLVRDLFSRCSYDGKRIDQLWLNDISHKAKYAYDIENNGLDSILCGSLYDYAFASDGNFAHTLRDGLFETTNKNGYTWRNDLVAINICRGREHGLPSYNAFREYCKLPKAYYFEDFGDTINYDGIQRLKKIYNHPDDVDSFVGMSLEDPVPGGLIGPVSACIILEQFRVLAVGDRFFFTQPSVEGDPFTALLPYSFACFFCDTVDIEKVPCNPFQAPDERTNPLFKCAEFCKPLDLSAWSEERVTLAKNVEAITPEKVVAAVKQRAAARSLLVASLSSDGQSSK